MRIKFILTPLDGVSGLSNDLRQTIELYLNASKIWFEKFLKVCVGE